MKPGAKKPPRGVGGVAVAAWTSCLGLGYAPVAPGTFGTLAGLPLAWVFSFLPLAWRAAALAAFIALAIWTAGLAETLHGQKDDGRVVIDEAAGYLVGVFLFAPTALNLGLGFVFFRVFDILKPWPASAIDRRMGGGAGVVLDDVAAGAYAALAVWAAGLALGRGM